MIGWRILHGVGTTAREESEGNRQRRRKGFMIELEARLRAGRKWELKDIITQLNKNE
jgi:hypothetical protein